MLYQIKSWIVSFAFQNCGKNGCITRGKYDLLINSNGKMVHKQCYNGSTGITTSPIGAKMLLIGNKASIQLEDAGSKTNSEQRIYKIRGPIHRSSF